VTKSAWYQLELLAKREPIEQVLLSGELSPSQEEKLRLIPQIKAFGEQLGLASTQNYDTVSIRWQREIYNFTACDPLAFEPATWWFPVVGSVPYLGFFREADAQRYATRYQERGYDVWYRRAGAYSTLGWFRDPILPGMLDWEEFRLAETVLHELAHATLWIKGSVSFNETFANVVGEEAAERWMERRYGATGPEVIRMRQRREDMETWRQVLHRLYTDLDSVYQNLDFLPEQRLSKKEALLNDLAYRLAYADFHDRERYLAAARRGSWNNARLHQYRTYNDARENFERLLEAKTGDLGAFIGEVDRLTRDAADPEAAIAAAAGLPTAVQKK